MQDAARFGDASAAAPAVEETAAFDYAKPADLFTRRAAGAPIAAGTSAGEAARARSRSTHRNALTYRRFASGAAAIRFAIEDLAPSAFAATVLVVDGERHEAAAIRLLYAGAGYPLRRRPDLSRFPRGNNNK